VRTARRAVPWTSLALSVLLGLLLLVPSGQASAATYRVTMQGYAFGPATLTVPAGSTVTWTNQDTAPHDVKTTSAPAAFHSPMLNKGGSWSFTFTTPGTYAYYCTVHPNMTARIVVRAPAPTPTHEHAEHTASGSSSGHHATAPSRPTMPRTPSSPSPTRPASHPAAAPPASPTPTPAPVPQTQATASTSRPLDPLLILTGLVAGVAVLCLLLVGSRASRTREEEG
jgi:amicyanin